MPPQPADFTAFAPPPIDFVIPQGRNEATRTNAGMTEHSFLVTYAADAVTESISTHQPYNIEHRFDSSPLLKDTSARLAARVDFLCLPFGVSCS
jgi:hypothetical protein